MKDQLTFKQRLYFKYFQLFRLRYWAYFFQLQRRDLEDTIPKVNLDHKNIQNLKTLLNREELIKKMPANGIVAEIGVDQGDFSELILKLNSPTKLHLIDAWAEDVRYHSGLKTMVEDKFKDKISAGMISLNLGYSTSVLQDFPNGYFDWVYLDTDHTYQTTKAELAILKLKVKHNGIISGHDYIIGSWVNGFRYGVIEAVNEFCVTENWEIIYLTVETDQFRSFAIQKLNDQ